MLGPRKKSLTLQIMEIMNRRIGLSTKSRWYLDHLLSGYQGELEMDALCERYLKSGIVLKDVKLKTPVGECQIDTLIVKGNWLIVYEVKNFVGEHRYAPDTLCRLPETTFDNPEIQCTKHCTRLKSLLRKAGLNFRIMKKVVYINPLMTLYEAPENNHFLMRSQIADHLKKVNTMSDYPNYQHEKLLKVLKEHERDDIRFDDIPKYVFEDFRKGVCCGECGSFEVKIERNTCTCTSCCNKEKNSEVLARSIRELHILFPNIPLNTTVVRRWCAGAYHDRRIQRSLKEFATNLSNEKKSLSQKP